eukprot:superscaffoldBa00001930_g12549
MKKERKATVVEEVTRAKQELYKIKAVEQGRQGCWTTWEGTTLNRSFVRPVESMGGTGSQSLPRCLSPGKDWQMMVDIGKQLHHSGRIWSVTAKTALLIELTILWEEGMQAAHECKRARYLDLAAECREAYWTTTIYPVEIGCQGFISASTLRLLWDVGVSGVKFRRAKKALAEETEKGSFWLWLRRNGKKWGST